MEPCLFSFRAIAQVYDCLRKKNLTALLRNYKIFNMFKYIWIEILWNY